MRPKIIFILSLQCLIDVVFSGAVPQPHPYLRSLERHYVTAAATAPGVCGDCGERLLLTPLLEADRLEDARQAAKVDPQHFLGRESYSGYLTVNRHYNSNLFFWYFPVQDQPVEETPLIMWLQGGPGSSSLYGLFQEIGPFRVNASGNLEEMPHSWGRNHSLLFVDNPVGTGFSFTEHESGYAVNQTQIGFSLYVALQQFLTLFPELRPAPLIIAGESYAGKHIPSLGIQIHQRRDADRAERPINLQGMAIGNGYIDPATLMTGSCFLREIGLIDDRKADEIREREMAAERYLREGDINKAHDTFNNAWSSGLKAAGISNPYNFLNDNDPLESNYSTFLEKPHIRKAVHVGNTTYNGFNMGVYKLLKHDSASSAKPWVEELLDHYRIMVFNGHLDLIVNYRASVNTYKSLVFEGAAEYSTAPRRVWRYPDEEVAGYYKRAGRFTEVMVRGAGHMVPSDKPAEALALITAFAHNLPLDAPEKSSTP